MHDTNLLPEHPHPTGDGESHEQVGHGMSASESVERSAAEELAAASIDALPDEAPHQFSLATLFAVLLLYSVAFAALRWIAPEFFTLLAGLVALIALGWVTLQPTSALARLTWWLGIATYLVAIWGTLSAS